MKPHPLCCLLHGQELLSTFAVILQNSIRPRKVATETPAYIDFIQLTSMCHVNHGLRTQGNSNDAKTER